MKITKIMLPDKKKAIKDWLIDDRPREKLRTKGPESLSHSELIAILLQNGTHNKSALDLAREILQLGRNAVEELGKICVKEVTKIKGIGEAKAVTIAAAMELGRRRQAAGFIEKPYMTDSTSIAGYLQGVLKDYELEVFIVLFLNQANKVNHTEVISKGGITGTVADTRVILKKALEEDALSIVLFHNHPSGRVRPSRADEALTQKRKTAAKYFDIRVLDHIIVSDEGYYSFADEGLL